MNLSDLRKLTIKKNLRIRFKLPNGMECILNEHGVANIPSLQTVPDFNLEEQLSQVDAFLVEPVGSGEKTRSKPKLERLTREQMAVMATTGPGGQAGHEDREE